MKHRDFAKALVAWRGRNDYTQQEAADKLGVSRRSLENWEQERAMPQGFGLKAMLKYIEGPTAGGRQKAPKKKNRNTTNR